MKRIRSIIRKTLTFFGAWNTANAIRRSAFFDHVRYRRWAGKIRINRSGRIALPKLDIYLTRECNLKCEFCSVFSPFRTGLYEKKEICESIERWSKKIEPENVLLLGGEPLLHPDYREIAGFARTCWPGSKVTIITNALLLDRVDDDFLQWMHDNDAGFQISKHLATEAFGRKLASAVARLDRFGVAREIIESTGSWVTCHRLDDEQMPVPAASNPRKAWLHCLSKYCTSIHKDRLFGCSVLLNMQLALEEGALSRAWRPALNHRPAHAGDSLESLLRYLKSGIMKECALCPETFESVEARQIPVEQIRTIKRILERETPDPLDGGAAPFV